MDMMQTLQTLTLKCGLYTGQIDFATDEMGKFYTSRYNMHLNQSAHCLVTTSQVLKMGDNLVQGT